jgi:hypothetical protein
MRALNSGMIDASKKGILNTHQSQKQWETQRKDICLVEKPNHNRRVRVNVGYGVKGPQLASFKETKSETLDRIDIKTFDISNVNEHENEKTPKKWKRQGLGAMSNIVKNLVNHLKLLFQLNLFISSAVNSISDQKPLRIFLSLSGDGSKLSKTNDNLSSNFISFCIQIIFDEKIFYSDYGVSVVCALLPWILISEKEEKEPLRRIGKWLSYGAKLLKEAKNVWWTEIGPQTSVDCDNYELQTGKKVLIKRPIQFSLLLVKGDSKFLQILSGTTMSNSDERCYQCSKKLDDWFQITEIEEFCGTKFLENYFSMASKLYGVESSTQEGSKLATALPPIFFPENAKFYEAEYVLSRSGLWSTFVSVDPLHIIENHSAQVLNYCVNNMDDEETKALKEFIRVNFQLKLKKKYTVAKWRLIWASYPVSFKKFLNLQKRICLKSFGHGHVV